MKRHKRLRAAMCAAGVTGQDIARRLDCSGNSVSARMTGRVPWSMSDAYTILDMLGLPSDQIYTYFPPGGIDPPEVNEDPNQHITRLLTGLRDVITRELEEVTA